MSQHAGVALVSGANKGIGREIAEQLARSGFTVLLGVRNPALGAAAEQSLRAAGLSAQHVALDLTDIDTIRAAAEIIENDYGALDVLVNNAGIAVDDAPPSQLGLDRLRRTFDTNFFGTVAVTQIMLPLLRRAEAGRIVNLSSELASLTLHGDPDWEHYPVKLLAYNASKTAVNAFTVHLAYELRDTPIKVNSASPGYVATDLNGHRGTRSVAQGAKVPIRLATLDADGPTGRFFDEDGELPW